MFSAVLLILSFPHLSLKVQSPTRPLALEHNHRAGKLRIGPRPRSWSVSLVFKQKF
jgi:hypothetical protein